MFRRRGRPGWYFKARFRKEWRQIGTRNNDRRTSLKYEAMWNVLAEEHHAWDVLEVALGENPEVKLGDLHDLWLESRRDVHELRRRLADVDVSALVDEFLKIYGREVAEDTKGHVEHHIRWLLPKETAVPRSRITVEWLTERLYAYPGSRNTLRKVHSAWSVFFAFCVDPKALFEANPMERVRRPAKQKHPPKFYELDVVERIVHWQPTEARRAMMALLYGTAIDTGTAAQTVRADFLPHDKEIKAPGTKTLTRHRVVRVADWAWPIVWGYAKTVLPAARLWPDVSRHVVHDWHREALDALKLEPRYPPRNARHHWAVRALRAGTPIAVVQAQLGHGSPQLTLDTYGQFIPSGSDREKWEQAAGEYERKRREAQ